MKGINMKFVLASRNAHKIAELRSILAQHITEDFELLSLDDIGFEGDIEENGTTYEENAIIKASVPAKMGYFGIADDSGLSVDALNGAPGIYSARYAGEPCDNEANNSKLLKELNGLKGEQRSAAFVCTMAVVAPDGKHMCATGRCPGIILEELTGEGGFGYDPLFYYEPCGKTFAQLTAEEKNRVSHRATAIKAFAKALPSFIKDYKNP